MNKVKKFIFGLLIVGGLFSRESMAMQEDTPFSLNVALSGAYKSLTFRSVRPGDEATVLKLVNQMVEERDLSKDKGQEKHGLPDDPISWTKNHFARQAKGNLFSAFVIETVGGEVLGVLGTGRMPILNYDPKFGDIIETYLKDFGVTKVVNENADPIYAKDNIVGVQNQGVGIFIPIFPQSMGAQQTKEALELTVSLFRHLKPNALLPFEGNIVSHVIALLHPDDPIQRFLEEAKFEIIRKEGFFGFYDKPRDMAHIKL